MSKMLCTGCRQQHPESMFYSVDHKRYVAFCAQCRLTRQSPERAVEPKVVEPKAVVAGPEPRPIRRRNVSARVDRNVMLPKRGSNIRLIPDAGLAQSIKHVIDQL